VFILLSFVILAPRNASGGPASDIGGLIERVLVLVAFAWHVVIGWRLFALPTQACAERRRTAFD
jgi:hypothetical protein